MTSLDLARAVAREFDFPTEEIEWFAERGNINLDAFILRGEGRRALLQRISPAVFSQPERVVKNMLLVTEAQRAAAPSDGVRWEVPVLVPRHDGAYTVEQDGTWRLMAFIEESISYKRLGAMDREAQLRTARECGRGLALWLDRTSGLDPASLRSSLPGYRNAGIYLDQWDAAVAGLREGFALPADPEVRASCEAHFAVALSPEAYDERRHDPEIEAAIAFVAENRDMLTLIESSLADGRYAPRAIHGDTKLENFLFDHATGAAIALVDLDTIMPHSWLVDWGDMVRSLCNVAGENERDLDAVRVDGEIYASVTEGFLGEISSASEKEVGFMPHAVILIAIELGIRFLADYLRGDTYFALGPGDAPDLNRVRGLVQLRLARRLQEGLGPAVRCVHAAAPEELKRVIGWEVVEHDLYDLAEDLRAALPEKTYRQAREFAWHREPECAWTELWYALYHTMCPVTEEQHRRLVEFGRRVEGNVDEAMAEAPLHVGPG